MPGMLYRLTQCVGSTYGCQEYVGFPSLGSLYAPTRTRSHVRPHVDGARMGQGELARVWACLHSACMRQGVSMRVADTHSAHPGRTRSSMAESGARSQSGLTRHACRRSRPTRCACAAPLFVCGRCMRIVRLPFQSTSCVDAQERTSPCDRAPNPLMPCGSVLVCNHHANQSINQS